MCGFIITVVFQQRERAVPELHVYDNKRERDWPVVWIFALIAGLEDGGTAVASSWDYLDGTLGAINAR